MWKITGLEIAVYRGTSSWRTAIEAEMVSIACTEQKHSEGEGTVHELWNKQQGGEV